MFEYSFTPHANDIFLWAEVNRIPPMPFRVPQIEVIMMDSNGNYVPCACLLIESNKSVRIELFSPPKSDDVFVAELRRVTIGLHVVLVGTVTFDIHVPPIPAVYTGY